MFFRPPTENPFEWLEQETIRLTNNRLIAQDLRTAILANDQDGIRNALLNPDVDLELDSLLKDEDLEFIADVSEDRNHFYTALSLACRFSTLETVKLLVESGAKVDGELSASREHLWIVTSCILPLHAAILSKDIAKVNYLLEQSANPNLRFDKPDTKCLLQISNEEGTPEISELLIANGAVHQEPVAARRFRLL